MNPLEFPWTEDQQITVTNPTDQPYRFKVHNKDYELGARKSAKMPGYIAWVYVYGMSVQLAHLNGEFNRWNEEGFRQEYYERLVKGVDELVQNVETQEEPSVNTFDEAEDEDLGKAESGPADKSPAVSQGDTKEEAIEKAESYGGETYTPERQNEVTNPTPELEKAGATTPDIQPMKAKVSPRAKALRSNS